MTSDIAFGSTLLSKIGFYTGSELYYYHIRREILKLKPPLRCLEQSVQALQPASVCLWCQQQWAAQRTQRRIKSVIHSGRNSLHLWEGRGATWHYWGAASAGRQPLSPNELTACRSWAELGFSHCFAVGVKANLWLTWELRGGMRLVALSLGRRWPLQTWDAIE